VKVGAWYVQRLLNCAAVIKKEVQNVSCQKSKELVFLHTSGDAKAYVQRYISRTFYLNTAGTPAYYKIFN